MEQSGPSGQGVTGLPPRKDTDQKGKKRIRQSSSEEEIHSNSLKEITNRLGQAMIRHKQHFGKAMLTYMHEHERELRSIYTALKQLQEVTTVVQTATQATQTEYKFVPVEPDILSLDLSDEELIELLPQRWNTRVMSRVNTVTLPVEGQADTCQFVDVVKSKRAKSEGKKAGMIALDTSSMMEDADDETSHVRRFTIFHDTTDDEKQAASCALNAIRRVLKKSPKAIFILPSGPYGNIIRKILIYLHRSCEEPVSVVVPRTDTSRARSRSASARRSTPPVEGSKIVVIKAQGKSYAELLRVMKDKVFKEEAGEVLSLRKGRNNELEVRIKGEECATQFTSVLRERAAELQVDMRTRGDRRAVVHIKDLEPDVTERDIQEAIVEIVGGAETFKVSSIRQAYGNTQNATIITNYRAAVKLVANRIKVGWVHCRAYIRTEYERCHRCWSTGHKSIDCRGPDRTMLCYNCGGKGHLIRDCREPMKCLDCNSVEHRTGGTMCGRRSDA